MKHKVVWGWVAALTVVIIWGLTGVVSKPLSQGIDPINLTLYRSITSIIGLGVIVWLASKKESLSKELGSSLKIDSFKSLFLLFFCGVVGQGLFTYFNFLSLKHIGATENMVVQGMQPFATVLFGVIFFHFRMKFRQWITLFISLLLVIWITISTNAGTSEQQDNYILGYLFVILSMCSLAFTAHLRNHLAKKFGSGISMFYQYIGEAFMFMIIIIVLKHSLSDFKIILFNPLLLFLLIFLGVGISGISYLIQLYSFKYITVEKSTMTLNLMPLVGYISAIILFGEIATYSITIGIILLVIMLYIFNKDN
ncbi:multidrug transporter [Francisella halioticida]|uniref:Multidrug transporter n=2 Tax=Francisella halioticida TaxID=549298 RepID=A0ABN5AV39_9GAMM|nr:multidrug transporter [Francisella halioticida]